METSKQDTDEFAKEYKLAGLFIENAKTYVQLSTGALVLSVTFVHDVLGIAKGEKVPTDLWLVSPGSASSPQSFPAHSINILRRSLWSGSQPWRDIIRAGLSS